MTAWTRSFVLLARRTRGSAVMLGAVAALGAGCHVGGGTLTGTGGGMLETGAGGSTVTTGGGGINTGGGGVSTGAGGSISTGTAGVSGNTCGAAMQAAAIAPRILILLDTSASMNDGYSGSCSGGCGPSAKWPSVVSAIESVVDATAPNANWGLQFIGSDTSSCGPGIISVPIGSGNGVYFTPVLEDRSAGGALASPTHTPTAAAIQVATAHLAGQIPGPPQVILLITDGPPDCQVGGTDPSANDTTGAIASITSALDAGINTFVIGLGVLYDDAALNPMAQAGGLARAAPPYFTPAGSTDDLVAAMKDLVDRTSGCTFFLPAPPNDPSASRGNIAVMFPDGTIPQDSANGWMYTDQTQTIIQLYGAACGGARSGKPVYVVYRCLLI
jgi:hypothetical protein